MSQKLAILAHISGPWLSWLSEFGMVPIVPVGLVGVDENLSNILEPWLPHTGAIALAFVRAVPKVPVGIVCVYYV